MRNANGRSRFCKLYGSWGRNESPLTRVYRCLYSEDLFSLLTTRSRNQGATRAQKPTPQTA